jgi:hypothetical protein
MGASGRSPWHFSFSQRKEMNDRREEQISGDIGFSLPSMTTLEVAGVVVVGVILLVLYQAGKSTVRYVGEHPEVIKYAAMAAA